MAEQEKTEAHKAELIAHLSREATDYWAKQEKIYAKNLELAEIYGQMRETRERMETIMEEFAKNFGPDILQRAIKDKKISLPFPLGHIERRG